MLSRSNCVKQLSSSVTALRDTRAFRPLHYNLTSPYSSMAKLESGSIMLIQEVEKYPCLYDTSLQASKEEQDKAWAEISQVMLMTGSECRDKWKNLHNALKTSSRQNYLPEYLKFLESFSSLKDFHNNTEEQQEEIQTESTLEKHIETQDIVQTSVIQDQPKENKQDFPERLECEKKETKSRFECSECEDGDCLNILSDDSSDDVDSEYSRPKKRKLSPESTGQSTSRINQPVKNLLEDLKFELRLMSNDQFKIFKRKVLSVVDDVMQS